MKSVRLAQLHSVDDDAPEILSVLLSSQEVVAKELPTKDVLPESLGIDSITTLVVNNPDSPADIFND